MKKLNNQGFSLVELIIVIAIMAVLIGVLSPIYAGQTTKAKKSTDLQNAQTIASQLAIQAAEDEVGTGTAVVTKSDAYIALPTSTKIQSADIKAVTGSWVYSYKDGNIKVGIKIDTDKVAQLYPSVANMLQKEDGTSLTGTGNESPYKQ